jgi:hypothetical protein
VTGVEAGTPRHRLNEVAVKSFRISNQLQSVIALKPRQADNQFQGKISHSPPPWNSAAAFAFLEFHQLTRELEARFKLCAKFPVRDRGGSDENTRLALVSLTKLSEKVSDAAVLDAVIQLDKWLSKARIILGELEFPQRLPRLPGKGEPVCPFCKHKTLRAYPLRGYIICVTPLSLCHDEQGRKPRATLTYSNFTCQLELVWQDNVVGLPAEEAA